MYDALKQTDPEVFGWIAKEVRRQAHVGIRPRLQEQLDKGVSSQASGADEIGFVLWVLFPRGLALEIGAVVDQCLCQREFVPFDTVGQAIFHIGVCAGLQESSDNAKIINIQRV